MERKILDIDENMSTEDKKEHVDENQGKTVTTGFLSETTSLLGQWRQKQVHQVSEHVEKRTERKKS